MSEWKRYPNRIVGTSEVSEHAGCSLFILYYSLPQASSVKWFHVFISTSIQQYSIVRNFQRMKLRISRFVPIHESFLHKIWLGGHFGNNNSKQSKKSFLQEDFIFYPTRRLVHVSVNTWPRIGLLIAHNRQVKKRNAATAAKFCYPGLFTPLFIHWDALFL